MAVHNGRWWIARGAAGLIGVAGAIFLFQSMSGGPTAAQLCSGSLVASTGQTVSVTRGSSKYCTFPDAGMTQLGSNVPVVEANGLSVEGSSTNLALRSEAFDNATWTKNGFIVTAPVVTADAALAPNGTTTADQIAYPLTVGAGSFSVVGQQFLGTVAPYSASVYLRDSSGSSTIYLSFCRTTAGTCAGAVYIGTTSCALTTSWTRCKITAATLTATNYAFDIGVDLRDVGQLTQGTQTVFSWGAQVEQLGFPSSYIPTTTATAGRSTDVATILNPLNGSQRWTFSAKYSPEGTWNDVASMVGGFMAFGSNAAANSSRAFKNGGGLQLDVYDIAAAQRTNNPTDSLIAGGATPAVLTFVNPQNGNLPVQVNGTTLTPNQSGSGTGIQTSEPTSIWLGSLGGGSNQFYGWMSDISLQRN